MNRLSVLGCHIFLCLTLFGILSVSCENEQGGGFPLHEGVAASFVPTISGESATRVVDNRWSGTEVVGIAAFDAEGGEPFTTKYHQYIPNVPGTSIQLLPFDGEDPIYFPTDGSELTFTAFAPYVTPENNEVNYTLTTQDTDINKMEKLDFIHHKGTKKYSQSNSAVALTFEHKLCRVVINLTRGSGYTNDIAEATARINNVYTEVSANLSAEVVTASGTGAGNISPYRSSGVEDACTFQAIVAPQTDTSTPSASDRTLTFMVNSISYTIEIPQNWHAGMSYTYDIELTPTGVILAGSSVSSWGEGTMAWAADKAITVDKYALNFGPSSYTQTVVIKVKGTIAAPMATASTSAESIMGKPECILNTWDGLLISPGVTDEDWTTYTLSVISVENPDSSTNREAFIHVQVDRLSVVIKVTQFSNSTLPLANGNTNCFMVAPGATIHFPVTRAITQGGASALEDFGVIKLWDDTPGGAVASYSISGTGSNAVVSVTAGPNPGNALICVYDKANYSNIYWSWHIWVTDYDPSKQDATFTNTWNTNNKGSYFVFMDRNLGATNAGMGNLSSGDRYGTGLFYQWGRKDPFPATGTPDDEQPGNGKFTTIATSAENGTVGFTIKNPNKFITADDLPRDWHGRRDNTLWGHGNTTGKSVYDPCPAGWRVPSHNVAAADYTHAAVSPWWGFQKSVTEFIPINLDPDGFDYGYSWGTNAQYPATGWRNYSGELAGAGTHGFYWSASPYFESEAPYAAQLHFIEGKLFASDGNYRANGCSVRCVREN